MFPIDVTLLPSLATRRALLVVDAQNDFLAEDGALPAKMPVDLPQRISDLAGDFRRSGGEIIWVQSRFESSRPVDEEQIMISETSSPSSGSAPAPPRGRRPRTNPPAAEVLVSPEAFLTPGPGNGLSCVRVGTPGIEMHPVVKQAVGPRDHVLTKTFYSAFRVDELLRLLRMRLVTELFICGSSTNIGVMATAVDAASYGYTITIVDDCCGSQSMSRHRNALRQITSTTGCETLSAAKVLGLMRPKPKPPAATSERGMMDRGAASGGRSPTVRLRRGKIDAAIAPSPVSDIQPSLEKLSLSDEPVAADEYAPETSLAPPPPSSSSSSPPPSQQQQQQQQRRQPQSRSQSQSQQSQRALQSMARPGHPQTKNHQTDRDTLTPAAAEVASAANGHVSATTRRSAAGDKIPDDGRHDSGVRSDELVVVGAAAADLVTWGSMSSSSSSKRRRSQQKRTPPPAAAAAAATTTTTATLELLRPGANANADNVKVRITNDNVDNDNNKAAPIKSKGVESPSNANIFESSSSSSEISDTNTRRHNDRAISSTKTLSSKVDSKRTTTKMTSENESEPLCEGDTQVIYDILPADLARDMFTRLHAEVAWERMSHQGGEVPRLVAVQGLVATDDDGSKPVYRHPADASPPLHPFTPAVDAVRRIVEEELGHELNHVLIQLYRSGEDFISEHSDKTLDIARDSFIANVSIGAERTMTLRTKRRPKGEGEGKGELKRSVQRATLPHNSLFKMGLKTNMRWLHGVRADKRTNKEKSAAELACEGARISLTFRRIATYLDAEETKIWGQGATAKTRDAARPVVNGQTDQAVAMLKAFGRENQDTEFDWDANYGMGFDVLHIGDAKRLFLSGDPVVDLRIRVMLAEFGVSYARGSLGGGGGDALKEGEGGGKPSNVPIRFIDNDENKTAVDGQGMIMQYLQKTYGGPPTTNNNEERIRERWTQGLRILDAWRSISSSPALPSENPGGIMKIEDLLSPWEKYASEDDFIAGPDISLADFAFWPVLADILSSSSSSSPQRFEKEEESKFPHLLTYHDRMCGREGIARLLER
ncbi:hypothetical protein FHL15_007070 [Xylaria flabelliformis]|uniref:Fe2OG dioxygenase domain-containing protein n=1 Tax=Xylaria flabelliformis TaxID=2512241 RepID=A0A553HVJ5_9PEZI|nr:hypothetical protein FHL15_007070 [Xylaria flabelliformis]